MIYSFNCGLERLLEGEQAQDGTISGGSAQRHWYGASLAKLAEIIALGFLETGE